MGWQEVEGRDVQVFEDELGLGIFIFRSGK